LALLQGYLIEGVEFEGGVVEVGGVQDGGGVEGGVEFVELGCLESVLQPCGDFSILKYTQHRR